MSTVSDQLYQFGGVPVGVPISQGKCFFVKPYSGNDAADGLTPATAVKTWYQAHELVTADKNDTVYILSESNTAANTTDYQSATLTLSKDGVRWIGVNSGNHVAQRSRIAWLSTFTSSSDLPLITISADNCYFENLQFYSGVNDANLSFCCNLTGSRNHFVNVHFAGIGHDTNDAAGAYSLKQVGSENLFQRCVIGLDSIGRGSAANSEILISGGGARNVYEDCLILTYADANTHQFIIKEATGHDRFTMFKNCIFQNSAVGSGGATMTEAIDYTASTTPGGYIIMHGCSLFGATDWEASTVSGEVLSFACTSTAATTGLAVAVAAS